MPYPALIRHTYAIGDIQGCLSPLKRLLTTLNYDPAQDALWFTGDIVNRGPDSLACLRFICSLPADRIVCVLGNHDLALLCLNEGFIKPQPGDTFEEILLAPDKTLLLEWLRHRPLLHHCPSSHFTLSHAGIFPTWDLSTAQRLAQEVETALRGPDYRLFLAHMFGSYPTQWNEKLLGWERLRFITNAFTRMRFLTPEGELEFLTQGNHHPTHFPWFMKAGRKLKDHPLIFGHWAALGAVRDLPFLYPLDSGCVWGECLTAFCLESGQYFTVDCADVIQAAPPIPI